VLGGLVVALAAVGLEQVWLVTAGVGLACAGLLLRTWSRYRSGRLRRALDSILSAGEREAVFSRLAELLRGAARADWVGLVDWEEDGLGGSLARSGGEAPPERALMSWLVREAESREELLTTSAQELGGPAGVYMALPLRRENSALVGFLTLRAPRVLSRPVRTALGSALDELGVSLAEDPSGPVGPEPGPHSSGGILRTGSDLSVIAVNGVGPAVESAALKLGSEGVSVEVVELNGNRAWSEQAVLESVRKTSKVVLVHEEQDGAEAAELAALIAERAFESLDGPVRRARVDTDLAETLRDLAGF